MFTFTSLFAWPFLLSAGLGLAALPIIIHLINMMRHRRVKWAAMDFLLQSHKKHRNWIWLKQLLLLLLRVAAVLLALLTLGGIGCQQDWLAKLGSNPTHHYVLLDDSYSMSDRAAAASVFERALQVVKRVAGRALSEGGSHRFTLVRFSRAADGAAAAQTPSAVAAAPNNAAAKTDAAKTPGSNQDGPKPAGPKQSDPGQPGAGPRAAEQPGAARAQIADLGSVLVDRRFAATLDDALNRARASQTTAGPLAAIKLVQDLLAEQRAEKNIVYVISDFRAKEWENPAQLKESFQQIKANAQVQFIACAEQERGNLALVDLAPADETRAAGVPLFVNVKVKNFGATAAKKVQLKLKTHYHDPLAARNSEPGKLKGATQDLPLILIDEIRPGETVEKRAQVFFEEAGQHVVEAVLPDDAVLVDNRRWCVVDLPEGEPVLIVDGHLEQKNAYYLTSAFNPGPRAKTGVRPRLESPAFLRDAAPDDLRQYSAIYLLDVPRLDPRAVENLENQVRAGGGLAIFVGPQVNFQHYNEALYKNGAGLLPAPLGRDGLLEPELENTPDVLATEHPIFERFLGERNSLIKGVTVERYLKPPAEWRVPPESTVEIAAFLRNNDPLFFEQKFGEGRVVLGLTTLGQEWNDWATNPTFIVVALKLQSHLAGGRRFDAPRAPGEPIAIQTTAERFQAEVAFVAPTRLANETQVVRKTARKPQADSPLQTAVLGGPVGPEADPETELSGVYEAWLKPVEGPVEVRRVAVNVDPSEGDLALVESAALLAKLQPLRVDWTGWDKEAANPLRRAGLQFDLSAQVFFFALMGVLLLEMMMAYVASSHPSRGVPR